MNRIFRYVLLVVAFLAAGNAIATPVSITATRGVEVGDITGPVPGPNSPSNTLGLFQDDVMALLSPTSPSFSEAHQNTTIDAATGNMFGSGAVFVDFSSWSDDDVYADSFFDVFFELDVDHAYSLNGVLSTLIDGGSGRAVFDLSGPTSLSYSVVDYEPAAVLASAGVLLAGVYHLVVDARFDRGQATGYMGGWVDFDFNLNMRPIDQPVPEPVTVMLMMLGLAGLGLRRRR